MLRNWGKLSFTRNVITYSVPKGLMIRKTFLKADKPLVSEFQSPISRHPINV